MAGTYLNFPFNEELFRYYWEQEEDTVRTTIFQSGAIVNDATIAELISKGSSVYTMPMYGVLGGEPQNYDGATNIVPTTLSGKSQTGVVWGRAKAWKAQDFIRDFNSGANPLANAATQVGKYWSKYTQGVLLGILKGALDCTPTTTAYQTEWANHTYDISSATTTVADGNKFNFDTSGNAAQQACGDNSDIFTLIYMHSAVANRLEGMKLLEFLKYTDANGVERKLNIGQLNGRLVVVNDKCPVDTTGSNPKYTSYMLGVGSIRYAEAPLVEPGIEPHREPLIDGGTDEIITRIRRTIHPAGLSFLTTNLVSPTNVQLSASTAWDVMVDPKSIAIARIISNN